MYDDEEKRCHHTDGIVFSPNSPYICSSSENYLKWKWTDQVTIDLLGEIKNNGELQLLAAAAGRDNNNSIDLSSTIKLAVNTQEALQQEIRKTGGGVVVELGYCHKDGLWHSKGYRFDKKKGNFITTAFDAIMQLGERITQDELLRNLSPHHSSSSSHLSSSSHHSSSHHSSSSSSRPLPSFSKK
eukprot:c21736_g1_i7.p1 GENE.c21736_g1_i7~~c21736_g1_i7.p1  ORF type:complete len:185 (-),score=75.49 c21736_g1_i7:18-572(-)